MLREGVPPSDSYPYESFSWFKIWVRVLTHPSVATFQSLLQYHDKATWRRAFRWIFLTAFGGICAFAMPHVIAAIVSLGDRRDTVYEILEIASGIIYILAAPVLAVVLFAAWTGISRLVAAILGGTGTYSKLAFASAAFTAPLLFVSPIIGSIPYVSYLLYPLCLYLIVLSVLAVQAAEQFEWESALAAVFAANIPIAVVCFLLGLALFPL